MTDDNPHLEAAIDAARPFSERQLQATIAIAWEIRATRATLSEVNDHLEWLKDAVNGVAEELSGKAEGTDPLTHPRKSLARIAEAVDHMDRSGIGTYEV